MTTNRRPGNLVHVRGVLLMKQLEWTSSSSEASSEETKTVSPTSVSQCALDHSISPHQVQSQPGEEVNPCVCAATSTVDPLVPASSANSTSASMKKVVNVRNAGGSQPGVLHSMRQSSFQLDIDIKQKKICDPPLHVLSISPQDSGSDDTAPSETDSVAAASKDLYPTPHPTPVADTQLVRKSLQAGLLFGNSPSVLHSYLTTIIRCRRHFGIYISDKLRPQSVSGVMQYRKGHEYMVVQQIHGKEEGPGVYICQDLTSEEFFILKRISISTDRLIGIEFLAEEDKPFLPKIYGVFKDEKEIHIYQEYVPGGTLENCRWSLLQIREFAEELLLAFSYLHSKGLAHFDVKLLLLNRLVPAIAEDHLPEGQCGFRANRSTTDMVFVLRQLQEKCREQNKGYTIMFLPPWHDRLRELTTYDPVLQTADLWGIACILVCCLMQLGTHCKDSAENKPGLWSEALEAIQQKCTNGCKKGETCSDCKREFLMHLTNHGHKFLSLHLRCEMGFKSVEENVAWDQLRSLLWYLTDTDNVDNMQVDNALTILRGDRLKIELGDTT